MIKTAYVNQLSNDKIDTSLNIESIWRWQFQYGSNGALVFDSFENIVVKGENTGYQHF